MELLAQISTSGKSSQGRITNPALGDTLQTALLTDSPTSFFSKIISNLITLGFIIGSIIFFAMLIMGGIQWISSGGDKQGLEAARGRITSALIGIVILFTAYAIFALLESFFGIKILTLDIGSLVIQ